MCLNSILTDKKSQFFEFQKSLERYCNVLPVFGFNVAEYDLNLIKPYFLPILVSEQDIEPTVIKKANQLFSFKIGDNRPLEIMIFLAEQQALIRS